jgi:hypothetical protein
VRFYLIPVDPLVGMLLDVTFLGPRIFIWILDFWKICATLLLWLNLPTKPSLAQTMYVDEAIEPSVF